MAPVIATSVAPPLWYNISITVGWTVMTFSFIHVPQKMNPDFSSKIEILGVYMKYTDNYWMDCPELRCRYSTSQEDESIFNEISLHLLDTLAHFVQTFMVTRSY